MKKIVSVIIALSVTVTALAVIIDKLYKKSPVGNVRSYGQFQVLRSLKKSVSSFAHSSCKTLLLTIGRWLNG